VLYIIVAKIQITPFYREMDLKDPEEAYERVRGRDTYLLESSEGGEKVARYSFIGFNPVAKITAKKGIISLKTENKVLKTLEIPKTELLEGIRAIMSQFILENHSLARFFGGLVGYISYDMIRDYVDLGEKSVDILDEPDCELIITANNLIFDHIKGKTYLVSHIFSGEKEVVNKKKSREELDKTSDKLLKAVSTPKEKKLKTSCQHNLSTFSSNLTKPEYEEKVRRAKEYIRAGDIFQVVLSQRLETQFKGDITGVYKSLKKINPSPYMYCLDLGDRKIVGSSPEMLVQVDGRTVVTYPIAGTRPRGKTQEEDMTLEKDMLTDAKERAEHVMLVDLGRNDVGRVAEYGSVKVTKFMGVEKYSHVQHMVSEVTGRLRAGMDEFEAFKSIFPAGTVTGAPKVRAMEIIEELEKTRRGIYAGAVGYFSFNHNMDMAISIRTIIFEKDKAYIQAGAGIVADSDPAAEYQESLNKANGLLKALREAGV
jgi:anthranilate synthase component 1